MTDLQRTGFEEFGWKIEMKKIIEGMRKNERNEDREREKERLKEIGKNCINLEIAYATCKNHINTCAFKNLARCFKQLVLISKKDSCCSPGKFFLIGPKRPLSKLKYE